MSACGESATSFPHPSPVSDVFDEDPQLDQQLREVESRLVARYEPGGRYSEDHIRKTVASLRARFAEARVRTFVPILVERAARAELGAP
jgi:hypothetical protein